MYQAVDLQLEDTAVQPCDYKQLPSTQGMHATFYLFKQNWILLLAHIHFVSIDSTCFALRTEPACIYLLP